MSRKVLAVYERECSWMDDPPPNFPYKFSPELGQYYIDFMEKFCRQSKGKAGGQLIKFQLFQLAKMQLVFGWVEKGTGLRRFREVFDIRGRKNGKSTETAAVMHAMLEVDGEAGPEIYCVANSKDQADTVFNECVNMRAQSPALQKITKKRRTDIYGPRNFGFIQALAAKTDTLDGKNAHFVCQDEPHEQRNSKLYDVMKQSQSFREQPLYWIISTNGSVREGFFDSKYQMYSAVALWQDGFQDYTVLPLIYELDSREEWTDEKCWEKANPGLGTIKSLKTLREHVAQAKRDPSFLPTVLTKDFNIPENSAESWLRFEDIKNETVADMPYLEHSYAIGGCDLSATTDLTCATLLIMKPNDPNYYVLQKYFLPEGRLEQLRETNDREAPYQRWAELGWLHVCRGKTVDYENGLDDMITALKEPHKNMREIAYIVWLMIREGVELDNEEHHRGNTAPTQKMIEKQLCFADLVGENNISISVEEAFFEFYGKNAESRSLMKTSQQMVMERLSGSTTLSPGISEQKNA